MLIKNKVNVKVHGLESGDVIGAVKIENSSA